MVIGDYDTPVQVDEAGTTVRLLPDDQWHRLKHIPGPLFGATQLPAPASTLIAVVEQHGAIVAYWFATTVVHLDPLYVSPEFRHHPKLARGLVGLMGTALQAIGIQYGYAVVLDADQPTNGTLAEKLGFARIPGSLYGGAVSPPQE